MQQQTGRLLRLLLLPLLTKGQGLGFGIPTPVLLFFSLTSLGTGVRRVHRGGGLVPSLSCLKQNLGLFIS